MPVPEAPLYNLPPTPLKFGERGGVLLQNPEAVNPVIAVKVVPQAVPGPWGTQVSGKGAWELRHSLRKTDTKDLQNLFYLIDWKPVPVNF